MITCRQTTELVSRSLDRPLRLNQRLRLQLHLLICRSCRRYCKQLNFLKRAASLFDKRIEANRPPLSPKDKTYFDKNIAQKCKS